MKAFESVDGLLDFAIEKEIEAATFYADLAEKMATSGMRQVFIQFSGEETKHRRKLEEVKAGKRFLTVADRVADLKIADYVTNVTLSDDMSYQDALVVAMKREKAAFRLYHDLAEIAPDDEIRGVLLSLAQEEAKHKLGIEMEYDKRILTDN